MQSFGSYLKSEREKKGIRLEEIASITKIHLSSLELMERDRWSELPPEPFIRGFITAYAKYVGLNPKEALETFRKYNNPVVEESINTDGTTSETQIESAPPRTEEIPEPPKPVSNADELSSNEATPLFRRTHLVAALGIFGVVVLITLAWIGQKETISRGNEPITQSLPLSTPTPLTSALPTSETSLSTTPIVAPTPSSEPSVATQLNHLAPTPSPSPSPVAESTPTPKIAAAVASPTPIPVAKSEPKPSPPPLGTSPERAGHELVVIGKYRSWIKVVIDDAPPIEYFLAESEKATYKATNKIKVVLGNSAGAEIFHNGEPTPGVKFSGTIRSYIFPPNARFPQDKVKRAAPTDSESTPPVKTEAPGQDE